MCSRTPSAGATSKPSAWLSSKAATLKKPIRKIPKELTIVNEQFARKYYGSRDAVGKRLRLDSMDGAFVTIIGVAKQSKYIFPIEPLLEHLYLPLDQNPATAVGDNWTPSGMTLMLQTQGPSAEQPPRARVGAALGIAPADL